ncbi:MAG: zf-HC2 domain-containing protein [Clostridia bacterium]|nr:zf-HC2 domain-containing protein [Clostridia bacterium]
MRCENIEKLIAAYADGELEGVQKDFVKAHIENCPHCAELYREYLALNEALGACAERAPDDLCDKVMAAIREEKAAPATKSRGIMLGRAATWMGVGVAAMLCISVATTALVRHMVNNAGQNVESELPGDQAPGTQASTEDGNWMPECTEPDGAPDDNVVPEQTTEEGTYESTRVETDEVESAPEEALPEDSNESVTEGTPEKDETVGGATEEEITQAPADTAPETQPEQDGEVQTHAPTAESSDKGWFGRVLEAIGDFFARIFDAVASLFGGDRRA